MMNRRLVAVTFVGMVVVAIALAVFGVRKSTAGGSSSSGGCFPPSLSVDLWAFGLDEFSTGQSLGNPADLAEDCEDICGKWQKNCVMVANIAKRCNAAIAGKLAGQFAARCKTLEDSEDQKDCKASSKLLKKFLKDCAKADAELGASCCATYAPFCTAGCLADNPVPLPTPGCFTDQPPNPSCYAEFLN